MAGEVRVPGAYSVSALTTVTQALFQAGGVTDIGSLRDIQVRRAGKVITTLTFTIYSCVGTRRVISARSLRCCSFRPSIPVEIRGEVRRPMAYELSGGETVADLINMAGGFTKEAFGELAVLVRTSLEGGLPTAESVNLLNAKVASLSLRDGDILQVPSTGDTLANGVSVEGLSTAPAPSGGDRVCVFSDLVGDAERDLLPVADLTYSLIVRIKNELLDIEVIQFSLIDSLLNPDSDGDPLLNVADQVLIFSAPDLEDVAPDEFALANIVGARFAKTPAPSERGRAHTRSYYLWCCKSSWSVPNTQRLWCGRHRQSRRWIT